MAVALDTATRRDLLQRFDFVGLFIELGWNYLRIQPIPIERDNHSYVLRPVAEKRGAQIFSCSPGPDGHVPPYAVRRQIERELAKQAHEHLIIFADDEQAIWQWMSHEPGRSAIPRETTFYKGQSGQLLLQQLAGIAIDVGEEETITLIDVVQRLKQTFDKDRVTKKFYTDFQREHEKFVEFIQGIQAHAEDRRWYASLMLNRLMFVYFIQQQGFLDHGNRDYLSGRLRRVQDEQGAGQFHTFYRRFLCKLFHDGLNTPEADRPAGIDALIGDVPYLNGGLFDVHELEGRYPEIDIPDGAFERLFAFFNGYKWHLDDRPLRSDKEINPDVLGYIFEKYVNQVTQKQMGTYYTKEDITEYIAKNNIIPAIFDKVKATKGRVGFFAPDGPVWKLLRDNPDDYFYDAVTTGVSLSLPPEVEAGRRDVARRGSWNRPADPAYALPTETWRESVARRERFEELWYKLVDGDVTEINDLITHNLDIRQFARDVIHTVEDRDLLKAFYEAIRSVTVLDPTCGSGAFLFAALNILQPLYEECLNRMATFVAKRDAAPNDFGPGTFSDFDKILAEVRAHGDTPTYFILKSIILNNLFGVDIMEEAVEICKLRLFLKLVSQLEPGQPIEPLPDIDFNIRAGNTLVGFTSFNEVRASFSVETSGQHRMLSEEDKTNQRRLEDEAERVSRLFELFQHMQTDTGMDTSDFIDAKTDLRRDLRNLNDELNAHLASWQYQIDSTWPKAFAAWQETHQPFHWFSNFYGVMHNGGFDVVLGNPPYVSTRTIDYLPRILTSWGFPDIYAHVLIRSLALAKPTGRCGMIVPLSLTFSSEFVKLREALHKAGTAWYSSFDNIPAAVFHGVSQRCTIWLNHKGTSDAALVTPMYRWRSEYRPHLTSRVSYTALETVPDAAYGIPRIATGSQEDVLTTHRLKSKGTGRYIPRDRLARKELCFSPVARNFLSAFIDPPPTLAASNLGAVAGEIPSGIRLREDETRFSGIGWPDATGST